MSRYIVTHGDEEGFHITVAQSFGDDGYEVTVWRGNHGTAGLGVIREEAKAREIAKYLYDALLPEHLAERAKQEEESKKLMAELAARPKPKPPKIPKNAPILDVVVCPECQELMLPDDVSDEHVYECSTCGTTAAGDDGRRCDQCNKFAAKIAETSCPECGAAMDEAEHVKARRATNGKLIALED